MTSIDPIFKFPQRRPPLWFLSKEQRKKQEDSKQSLGPPLKIRQTDTRKPPEPLKHMVSTRGSSGSSGDDPFKRFTQGDKGDKGDSKPELPKPQPPEPPAEEPVTKPQSLKDTMVADRLKELEPPKVLRGFAPSKPPEPSEPQSLINMLKEQELPISTIPLMFDEEGQILPPNEQELYEMLREAEEQQAATVSGDSAGGDAGGGGGGGE